MSRKTTVYAAVSFAMMAVSNSAQAACPIAAGKWFATMIASNNSGGTFSGTCTFTIKVNGNYTATCLSTSIGTSPVSGTASGNIKSNALCRVSGTMSSPGVADTTISGGILTNGGTQIVLAGHRGNPAAQVRMVILNRIADPE